MAEGGGVAVEGGREEGGAEVEAGAGWESVIMEGESESESGVRGFGGGERVDIWISITEKLQLTPPLPHDGGGGGGAG